MQPWTINSPSDSDYDNDDDDHDDNDDDDHEDDDDEDGDNIRDETIMIEDCTRIIYDGSTSLTSSCS